MVTAGTGRRSESWREEKKGRNEKKGERLCHDSQRPPIVDFNVPQKTVHELGQHERNRLEPIRRRPRFHRRESKDEHIVNAPVCQNANEKETAQRGKNLGRFRVAVRDDIAGAVPVVAVSGLGGPLSVDAQNSRTLRL